MLGIRSTLSHAALSAVLLAGLTAKAPAQSPPPIRVVSTTWLAEHVKDRNVVLLQVEMDNDTDHDRIPGARLISYRAVSMKQGALETELPAVDSLAKLFGALGITDSSLVVVTSAHEAPMASRVLMTLDYAGARQLAFLDGGAKAWAREKRPVVKSTPAWTPTRFTPHVRSRTVIDAASVKERIGKAGTAFIDTRTDGEFVGGGERHGMPSDGHLAGAKQLQWEQLFRDDGHWVLRDSTELAGMYRARMQPGDELVTYCWIGYRASMTWLAARTLGLPVRLFDGSYQAVRNEGWPVVKGEKP